jgi:hypothetical protein
VLPHGFVRIRFFGCLANRRRKSLLPLCRQMLQMQSRFLQPKASSRELWRCPRCGNSMLLIQLHDYGAQVAIARTEDSL